MAELADGPSVIPLGDDALLLQRPEHLGHEEGVALRMPIKIVNEAASFSGRQVVEHLDEL
jgi:hypothetical protein